MGTYASRVGSTGSIRSNVKRAGQKAAFRPGMDVMTCVGYGVRGIVFIMGFVGFSRIFTGGHYMTDILAGYAVGIAC